MKQSSEVSGNWRARCSESCPAGSGRGRWKRAAATRQYLAGGLLHQNLGETLERLLRRQYPTIQELFGQADPVTDPSLPLKRWEAEKQVSQGRRMAMYEHVLALDAQGCNQTEIAEQLPMSRKRVRQLRKRTASASHLQTAFNQARSPQVVSHTTIC